jgi:multiple sugar transport system substrate-binding protein
MAGYIVLRSAIRWPERLQKLDFNLEVLIMSKAFHHRYHLVHLVLVMLLVALGVAPLASVAHAQDVTLTYGWWSNGPTGDAAHRTWLDEFEKANPGIRIQSEILPWDAYWDKVRTTTAGGTAYDIIGMCSCFAAGYMDNGVFMDLSQMADFDTVAGDLDQGAVAIYNWNGTQYLLPVGLAARSLGYRKDMFDAAGVAYPDPNKPMTVDELIELAKKLTIVKDDKVVQYTWNPTGSEPWYGFILNHGASIYDSWVNPTHVTINTPEGIAGLTDLKRLIDAKVMPPIAEQSGNQWGDGGLASLRTNKVAMADLGPWNFGDILKDNLPIGNTVYPVAKAGDTSVLISGANGYGISKDSKNAEAAWTFLKWMSSAEGNLAYSKWSDFPANTAAASKVDGFLQPADLLPAVLSQLKGFQTGVISTQPDLGSTMFQIMRDMTEGRLTPEEAAAEMEKQGNELLGYKGE